VFVNGDDQPDMTLSESWDDEIERLLPARLSELFFFDGERIESLADSARSGDVLRTAVASLLGLDLVDHLAADLEILRSRQRQRLLSTDDQASLRNLEAELAVVQQATEDLRQRMGETRNRIGWTRGQLDTARKRLREQGGERFLQREKMSIERVQIEAQLQNVDERIREVAAGSLPLLLVSDQLQVFQQSLSERQPALPAEASTAVRQHLKQVAAWVRRRDFPKKVSEEIIEYLSKRIEELPLPEASAIPMDWAQLGTQLTALLEERLPRTRASAAQIISSGRKLTQRLDALEEQIKRVPEQEQVAAAFKEEGAIEVALKALEDELDALVLEEQTGVRRLNELNKRREALLTKEIDAGDAKRIAEYCERSIQTLAEFRSKLVQKRRQQLETLILEAFKMLSRKPNLIGRIRLDPDTMMLSLLTDEGQILATQQLSAGERQLLAVAMLWGLARASGRPVPVVIDTPLGRLDGEHRRALVERYFPDASHQVILLSTDQEVDADFSRLLDDSVAHRYLIGYSSQQRTSSFTLGYFPKVKSDAH